MKILIPNDNIINMPENAFSLKELYTQYNLHIDFTYGIYFPFK